MYLIAVQCARRYLHIANPYFIPGLRLIEMLARACRRGVKIQLMVAGEHNDTWWARQNSLRLYGRLLEAGVEIYEFQPTMLHQKTMVVDGVWATVGTANFDNRSFALSEETNVCFHDQALIEELEAVFAADLEALPENRPGGMAEARRVAAHQGGGRFLDRGSGVARPSMRHFRIATYNIHKGRGLDGRSRVERIARVLERVDADIIALQEVVNHEGAVHRGSSGQLSGRAPGT